MHLALQLGSNSMSSFNDIFGRLVLCLCLLGLVIIAIGASCRLLPNFVVDYLKCVRRAGLVAAVLLSFFVFGMIREGVVTQDDKEEYRDAMSAVTAERAAMGNVLLPSDGFESSAVAAKVLETPRTVPQEMQWLTFAHWAHGVFMCGERVDFAEGWLLPFGTNHLSSVEVMAWGEILPDSRSRAPIASLGRRVSHLPGVSSFEYGLTPSNSYAFAWSDVRDGRINGEPFDGRIEFFRNGDIAVTTNGVTTFTERELPFAHDGFGQDAEWVTANFTNATEILAMGYQQWVDGQVGEGLTNGLFKFTVTFPDDPPETIQLVVGDSSIAVTNAGDYVFLLEKGAEYEYGTIPFMTNVTYSAVDDVPLMRGGMRMTGGEPVTHSWTTDGGYGFEPQTEYGLGLVWWMPTLTGAPDVDHLGPGMFPATFAGVLSDYRRGDDVSFSWSASDGLTIVTPNAQTTQIDVDEMPSWAQAGISVTASVGGRNLTSTLENLTYGTNATPQVRCSVYLPQTLIVRNQWMAGSKSAIAKAGLSSDIETNGVLAVWLERGADKIDIAVSTPAEFPVLGDDGITHSFAFDGVCPSESQGDVELRCAFVDEGGVTGVVAAATCTVISPLSILIPSAPGTGLAVLRGAEVGADLLVAPQLHNGAQTQWQTAKRVDKTLYREWTLRSNGFPAVTLPMVDAGVFALRAITIAGDGCQSNAVEYVHAESEAPIVALKEDKSGPCLLGDRNHIGVCSTHLLLNIRNAALSHLGNAEYGKEMPLCARNGFSALDDGDWKCNAFVADIAIQGGANVAVQHTVDHMWPIGTRFYPPTANEWGDSAVHIAGWLHLDAGACPEPGMIVSRPVSGGTGHCGIVDYDGWAISARRHGVSRKAFRMMDNKCRYSKPEENNE